MRRAWEVLRFELHYQVRRSSTRIYFLIFVGLVALLINVILSDARDDGYFFNAPMTTALMTSIATMIALLVGAGVAGDAATRDQQARIDALIYTTPLGKTLYLATRFFGAFLVVALLLVVVPFGLWLATFLPFVGPGIVGPFGAWPHLKAYVVVALPNAFLTTAILFSVAALSRRAIAAYAGAAALFFAPFIAQGYVAAKLGKWTLAQILDPLGYTALRTSWISYNLAQKNSLALAVEGPLLANRILWTGVALAVLALAWARFRFAQHHAGGGGRGLVEESGPAPRWTELRVPRARRTFGWRTRVRQGLAVTSDSLRDLHRSRAWWIVPVIAMLFIVTAPEVLEVQLGTPGAATSARVASIFAVGELARLVALLIALSAGELVWRERDARIDAIHDVVPVPDWVPFLGKWFALALLLVVTEVVFLAAGVTVQVMLGQYDIDPGVYLVHLFGFQLSGYLLFAALALFLHVLLNQKYVGNAVAILAYVGIQVAPEFGVEHNLLLYGSGPGPSHTDMAGFGGDVGPWLWFTIHWSGWALLFALGAYLFSVRGEDGGTRGRIASARRRLTRGPAAVALAALAIAGGAGGFVFYNTNVLHQYRTDAEVEALRARYERRYGRYATLPQPVVAATKLRVDFHPKRAAVDVRGTYRLDNRSGSAVPAIHVMIRTGATTSVSFDRQTRLTLDDRDHGYRIYTLAAPLPPGESVHMTFEVEHETRGFSNHGRNPSVVANGSWIQHRPEAGLRERSWLPLIGYQGTSELRGPVRAAHGLSERADYPPPHDHDARHDSRGNEKIDFEAVVGTVVGQTAVAPGTLRRTWTEKDRAWFHYATDAPITNAYAIFSADYAMQRAQAGDVAIELYHHPGHDANVERMLRSVRASLAYHARHFGPYPHRQLKLVEYPSAGSGLRLTAHNTSIMFSEGFALVRPDQDERKIDLPFAVVAHEVAHQWWGHQLVPAAAEGSALLSESLAWYSAMLVVEETLGRDHLLRLLDLMRSQYLAPHATRSVPLLRATDRVDAYRTGPFAMFALREAVGAERVNDALRNLLARFDPARPPYPTSLDLYAELRAVTPPSRHRLLKDLFEEITFWELRTRSVDVRPGGRGTYAVTLEVEARKLKGDARGKETPVPMDDVIEVAVLGAEGEVVYRGSHRIRSGRQAIRLALSASAPPVRAGVDPDHELLDRKPEDNFADVTTKS